jgi:hypothetical protein
MAAAIRFLIALTDQDISRKKVSDYVEKFKRTVGCLYYLPKYKYEMRMRMNFNWKRCLILLIPAAIIGLFLASSPYRAITSVPVIIAWIIYYIWGSLDKRKS